MRLSYLSRSARERKVVTPRGTAERRLAVRRRLQLDELERRCLLNAAPAAAIQVHGATLAATEGKPLTAIVAQFSDSDGATKVSGFTATITWGDGATSPGKVIVDPAHHNQFDIQGTHTYAEELSRGQVTVQVRDADGATAEASDPLRVADAALKAAGQTLIDTGQHTFQGTTAATFTDANPKGTITDYSATINWGDGTVTAGQVVKDPKVPGQFDVIGSHKYTNAPIGELVTTTINDIGGTQAGAQSKIVVQFTLQVHSLSVAATEGKSLTTPVAKFSDTNIGAKAGDFTATIDWGDGSPKSQGKVIVDSANPNQFDVQGTHTYAEELPRGKVAVTIHGTDGTSGSTSDPVQVADAALKATGTTLVDESLGRLQSVRVATFTDADPKGTITDYRATIAWGDGAITTGQVVKDPKVPGQFAVIGSHNYIADPFRVIVGNETITTTIKDIGGSQAVVQSQVMVAQPTKIGIKEGVPIVKPLTVAAFASNTTLNLAQYHATVDWGDGTTSVGTIKADTKIAHQYDVAVASRGPFEEEGDYLLVTTVTGPKGLNITIPGVVNVSDAPLFKISDTGPTFTTNIGTSIAGDNAANLVAVASFEDTDTHGISSDYSGTIDWGDGSPPVAITEDMIKWMGSTINGPSFTVNANYTYWDPGTYTITTTIVDADTPTTPIADAGKPITLTATATVVPGSMHLTAANYTEYEGISINAFNPPLLRLLTPSDANPADYQISVNWGDGTPLDTTPQFEVGFSPADAGLYVSTVGGRAVNHTYFECGTYPVTWNVRNTVTGKTGSVQGTIQVVELQRWPQSDGTFGPLQAVSLGSDLALAGESPNGGNVPAATLLNVPFSGSVARFSDWNPQATVDDFTATIEWGDGTITQGTIAPYPAGNTPQISSWVVSGSHTYTTESPAFGYTDYTVTIYDKDGTAQYPAHTITGAGIIVTTV